MTLGSPRFDGLVAAAPQVGGETKIDWAGVAAAMRDESIDPETVVAVTWSVFGTKNIEALIDPPTLAIIHPRGVLSTAGKGGMFSKAPKTWKITFPPCKGFGATETVDERNMGKYCIDFVGPGNVFLGRLEWRWSAGRFRDPREKMMAAAIERDRILQVVEQTFG